MNIDAFDWRQFWARRFAGWPWALLPAALALAWLLASRALGWQHAAADIGAGIVCFVFAVYGAWRIGDAQHALSQVAQQITGGRPESRADAALPGASGELAAQINALARVASQARDSQERNVLATTARLRQDQDRLQELNNELRRALRESRDAARTQSELFSNLSHELRTPLTAVLGYADLLRKSGLAAPQQQHLATLDRSARGMLTMINDLLDWSRIEAGKLRLHEDSFDVLNTVEDTTELLAPLAYDKNLELVRIFYHDVPRKLRGDAQRLRQIITNLVSNAIKFTHRGEVVLRVMRERDENARVWLRFNVADTGVGISPEQQRALFQPFQQAGRSVGGSGLGLSITRKLAELMGGTVELDSEPNRGSTFSVQLPFNEVGAERGTAAAVDSRLRERSVWLYEAHATARLALVHWLEFWGLRVNALASREALDAALAAAALNQLPAVIVVGLRASDVEDVDGLAQLSGWAQRVPLLAMLSSVSPELQLRLRAAGAAGCLPKSAGHEALHDELMRLVGAGKSGHRLEGQTLLLADNNLPNRRYIAALCAELGLRTFEAADGAQALELWTQQRPRFVLLDARMPALSGWECARQIRRLESADPAGERRCRIYAISAHLEPDERREFTEAGADGILLKPFDGRQLADLLSPDAGAPAASVSTRLGSDPAMLEMLLEELPQQYAELQTAMSGGEAAAARDATHQLHGTASFYHLSQLKDACASLERRLAQAALPGQCEAELIEIGRQLQQTLTQISARLQKPAGY